jgi:hypothetical protein
MLSFAAASLAMGALGVAAALKWWKLAEFRSGVADYGISSRRLTGVIAVAVPTLESIAVAAFFVPATRSAGALLAIGLLAAFSAALARLLLSGRRRVGCACFGTQSRPVSWLLPVRNILMASALAACTLAPTHASAPALPALLAALLGTTVLWLGYEFLAMRTAIRKV